MTDFNIGEIIVARNILILGNGFDIAMNRATKYTEFIEFANGLYQIKDEKFQDFINNWNIDINKYKNNIYLEYINKYKENLGYNWSNLEIMLSNIVEAIIYFKKNREELFLAIEQDPGNDYDFLGNIIKEHENFNAKAFILRAFINFFGDEFFPDSKKEDMLEKLNDRFIEELNLLIELLEIYLSYRDYDDFEVKKIRCQKTALDGLTNLSESYVLSFNYTHTAEKLFGILEERVHHIHGEIDLSRKKSKMNTIVFGIEDKENDVNSDLIPYQKYYQRVVKETGSRFEKYFDVEIDYTKGNGLPTFTISKNIIIFGHSVDPLDKEIFQKCFEKTENALFESRFIFTYYDEFAKRSLIKNLAIIIGKDKLVELTGMEKVVFVQSQDAKRMKEVLLP